MRKFAKKTVMKISAAAAVSFMLLPVLVLAQYTTYTVPYSFSTYQYTPTHFGVTQINNGYEEPITVVPAPSAMVVPPPGASVQSNYQTASVISSVGGGTQGGAVTPGLPKTGGGGRARSLLSDRSSRARYVYGFLLAGALSVLTLIFFLSGFKESRGKLF